MPLYSENSTVTHTGTCKDVWFVTQSHNSIRSGGYNYAKLRVDYNDLYYIPANAIYDYRYDEDKLKDTLKGHTVTLTCSILKNRHDFRTVLGIEVDGTEIISAEDTHSYFKSVRATVWAIYFIAVASLFLVLWQRSPDAVPVIKDKLSQIKEKLKFRK